jgi:hypothetical protein
MQVQKLINRHSCHLRSCSSRYTLPRSCEGSGPYQVLTGLEIVNMLSTRAIKVLLFYLFHLTSKVVADCYSHNGTLKRPELGIH